MRPVPKRAFAFRYIESLGQKIACPTEIFGCPGPSQRRMFEACIYIFLLGFNVHIQSKQLLGTKSLYDYIW